MRIKFLALALVASLVAVSAAVAKDHPGKGHKTPPAAAGTKCKLANVELKGMLAADVDPADGDTSFAMVVKRSNRHGRAFKAAGSATIMVDPKTKIRRRARAHPRRARTERPPQRSGQGLQERPGRKRNASADCAQDQRAPSQGGAPGRAGAERLNLRRNGDSEASERAPLARLGPTLYSGEASRAVRPS